MNIIIAILIFSIIIIIHELGHFLLAKKNGIFVPEFSLGMGTRIISVVKTSKGYRPVFFMSQRDFETTNEWKSATIYSWKLFPIGGSCAMLGEDAIIDDDRAFNKKGVWARISVIFAGPLFNFLLAFILSMVITGIAGYDPATINSVEENSPAATAGLQAGDRITNINGKHIDIGREVDTYFQFNPVTVNDVNVTYVRNGEKNKVTITPTLKKTYRLGFYYAPDTAQAVISTVNAGQPFDLAGLKVGDNITKINGTDISTGKDLAEYLTANPLTGEPITIAFSRNGKEQTVEVTPIPYDYYMLGFSPNVTREKTNALGIIKYGAVEVKYWIVTTIDSLGQLIVGKLSTKDMAGPVGIVSMIGSSYQESRSGGAVSVFLTLSYMIILLSANLGVMNLLPIPALDGGRLVFLFLEVFRGKPVDQTKEGLVHMIGLVALMIFMVFVMFNDISRLF